MLSQLSYSPMDDLRVNGWTLDKQAHDVKPLFMGITGYKEAAPVMRLRRLSYTLWVRLSGPQAQ